MTTPTVLAPGDVERVVTECRRVLAGNRQSGVSGWDGRKYDFTCPSPSTYPFQWWWDSAFIAIALLHVDAELAKQEVRCLLQGVQPDGFMPHMLLWEKSAHERALAEYSIRLAHPYFTRPAPKSTGREEFGAPFAQQLLANVKGAGGTGLSRGIDGSYLRWITRRVTVGRGEGASGLAFDSTVARKPPL